MKDFTNKMAVITGGAKCAVVALSEQLYFSLALQNSKIRTSVLCPGYVRINIIASERNRPAVLQNIENGKEITPKTAELREQVRLALENGTPPEQLAQYTFEAIREERFYIFSHGEYDGAINKRRKNILNRQNPDVMATLALLTNPVQE